MKNSKKILSLSMAATMLAGSTTAFAMPADVIVLGDKAFEILALSETDNTELQAEINAALDATDAEGMFYRLGSTGDFKKLAEDDVVMTAAQQTALKNVVLTKADGTKETYANFEDETGTVVEQADLTAYNAALNAVKEADYTAASWTEYQKVVTANPATVSNTQAEVDAAKDKIVEAQGSLVSIHQLEVESVSAINAHQLQITFSKALDKTSAETITNYALNIKAGANLLDGANPKAELDATKKVVTLSMENLYAGVATNQETLELAITNLKAEDNEILTSYSKKDISVLDTTLPTFVGVTQVSPTEFDLEFSEPVKGGANATALATAIRLNNGTYSVSAQTREDNNKVAPNAIRINTGTALPQGDYSLDLNNATFTPAANMIDDYADFKLAPVSTTLTVATDTVAPTTSVLKTSGDSVYVKFTEDVTGVTSNSNVKFRLDYNNDSIEATGVAYDSVTDSYKVTFADPITAGNHNLFIHYVSETATLIKDAAKNAYVDDVATAFVVEVDETAPTATAALNTTGTAIELAFSEDVTGANLQSSYELKDKDGNAIAYTLAPKTGYANTYVFTPTSQPEGNVTLKIKADKIKDTSIAQNYAAEVTLTLNFGDKVSPTVTSVTLDAATATKVYVNFNEQMMTTGESSMLNLDNYRYTTSGVTDAKFPTGTTIAMGILGNKSVVISLPSGIAITKIKVANAADISGNLIDPFTVAASTANQDNVVNLLAGGTSATTLKTTTLASGALGKITAKDTVVVYTDVQLAGIDASKISVNGVTAQSATYENMSLTAGDGTTTLYGAKVTITLPSASKYAAAPDAKTGTGVLIAANAFTTQNGTLSDGIKTDGTSGTAAEIVNTNATTWNMFTDEISPAVAKDASDIKQIWAFDHGPLGSADAVDGKMDTITVKFDEKIDQASVATGTFAVENYDVQSVTVSIAADDATYLGQLDTGLTGANGEYVTLVVTPKAGVTVGTDSIPTVTMNSSVRDASSNEGTDSATSLDKAGPVITKAEITVEGTTVDWEEVGDELTITFSEAPVIPAAITDAEATIDGLQLSAGDLNGILAANATGGGAGVTVAYDTDTAVTAVVDGNVIKLTVIDKDDTNATAADLTTGLDGSATPDEVAGGATLEDSEGNASVALATAIAID